MGPYWNSLMSLLLLLSFFAVVESAPPATPSISLQIDGKDVKLAKPRIQSATTTSGRPTFVVMGDLGSETVFVRATVPKAEPGSYPVRVMRVLRPEGPPRASLNIDSRPESGLPLLRPDGGTLEVKTISVDDKELISRFEASFNGEMSVSAGTKHAVVLSVRWDSAEKP